MLNGTPYVDQALTNVSIGYKNAELISERLFPVVPVGKQSGKYHVWDKSMLRADDDFRRAGTRANEVRMGLSPDTYYCDGHALTAPVEDETRANADASLNYDTAVTEQLTGRILLRREVNLVSALVAGLTDHDLSASAYANAFDTNTVDPRATIDAAKETIQKAVGRKPNVLVLGRIAFRGIRNNTLIKAAISGAPSFDSALITPQMLATVLEVDEVVIGDAVKLTSKEGQTETGDFVWGKYALLAVRPNAAALNECSLGYEFRWNAVNQGALVNRFREEREHSDWIEVNRYYDLKVTCASAGYLWSNTVQN